MLDRLPNDLYIQIIAYINPISKAHNKKLNKFGAKKW